MLPLLWDMVELDYDPDRARTSTSANCSPTARGASSRRWPRDVDVRLGAVVTRRSRTTPTGSTVTLDGRRHAACGGRDPRPAAELLGRRAGLAGPRRREAGAPPRAVTSARSRRYSRWSREPRRRSWARAGTRRSTPGSSPSRGDGPAAVHGVLGRSRASTSPTRTRWPPRSAPTCPRRRSCDGGPRLGRRPVLEGHLAGDPAGLVQRRHVRRARRARGPPRVRRLRHRGRGRGVDRRRGRPAGVRRPRAAGRCSGPRPARPLDDPRTPSFQTCSIRSFSALEVEGSPSTTTTSATLPGSSEPSRSSSPSARRPTASPRAAPAPA